MSRKYLFIFYFIFCMSSPALGGQRDGVTLPDTIALGQSNLTLNGMGTRTFTFFSVYVAGLYLAAPSTNAQTILAANAPRVMTMHFLREVPAAKIAEAWRAGLADNTPGADAALKERFDALAAMMETMASGQTLECAYDPAVGTTVRVKGATKGIIAGKDFADALLACWIGPKPGPGEKFRAGLLGTN